MRNCHLHKHIIVILYSFVLVLFLCSGSLADSQTSSPMHIDQYLHLTFTSNDILPADQIEDIAQDSEGYLWIASNLGAFRFDGRTFEHFTLANNPEFTSELLSQVETSPFGKIWLAGPSGLYYYSDGQFRKWTGQDDKTIDQIEFFKVDRKENLWIKKVDQLHLIKDNIIQRFNTQNESVLNVFVGQSNTIWVSCRGRKLLEIRNYEIVNQYELESQIDGEILSLVERKDGRLTFGIAENGIVHFSNGKITKPYQGNLARHNVFDLIYDDEGLLWVGGNGIYRFGEASFDSYSEQQGLTHFRIYDLFKDKHGAIWVASKKGLNLFSKTYVKPIFRRVENKLSKVNVTAIQVDKSDNIWVGSNGQGMHMYLDNELIIPTNATEFGEVIHSIQPARNGVFVCSNLGTFEVELIQNTVLVSRKLIDDITFSFYIASDSSYWYNAIVPGRGPSIFYVKNGTRNYLKVPVSNRVYWFAEFMEGIITMGTKDGLFNWYDGKIDSFQDRFGTPVDKYFGHHWDTLDNAKWFGAGGTGLVQLEGERVNTFNSRNGLPTNSIRGVFIDDLYNFILIGHEDVFITPVKQISDYHLDSNKLTYDHYRLRTMVNTIGFPNFAVDNAGHILIASNTSLLDLDPNFRTPYDVPVSVRSLEVDGKQVPVDGKINIEASNQRVEIRFGAIDFLEGRHTRFDYRLLGFEDAWKMSGDEPFAEYTNLPAGKYQFELRILNTDGTVRAEADPILLSKKQFWWKTGAAIAMYVIILAAIIVVIFQIRVRALKRQREVLRQKVNERTSELKELNETLEQKVEERTQEVVKMNNNLQESEERYRYALDASNDGIWDWDVQRDSIQFSPAIYTMLGYEPYEFEQTREAIYALIDQEDQKKWHIAHHEKLKTSAPDDQLQDEYKMLSKQGEIVWVQVKGKVVEYDEEGIPKRIVGTHTDITDEKQKTQEILEAILRTEDMERSRISKEIHDGLQQTLTISSLNFQALKKGLTNLGDKLSEKFEVGWNYLQESIKESRTVAHALMPKAIVDFGVISAFQSLIDEIDKVSDNTTFNFYNNFQKERIDNTQIEITFYRILQEAINNIIKYAQATQVDVQLKEYEDIYMLTIEDNGVGFDAQTVKEKDSGLGFRSMRNRVEAINGILEIDSRPGKGTSILVEINKTM